MTLWFSTWKSYSTYLFFSLTLHTMSKQAVFHTCDQHTNTQTRANVHWTHSCERTWKRADREKEGQSVYWEINNTNTTVGVLSIQLVLVEQRKDNVKNTALFVHRTLGKHTITYKFIYLNVDEKKIIKITSFPKVWHSVNHITGKKSIETSSFHKLSIVCNHIQGGEKSKNSIVKFKIRGIGLTYKWLEVPFVDSKPNGHCSLNHSRKSHFLNRKKNGERFLKVSDYKHNISIYICCRAKNTSNH